MKNRTAVITGLIMAVILTLLPARVIFADSTWTVYTQTNSPLPTDYVTSIEFSSDNNRYICTSGGGMAVVDGANNWAVYRQNNTGVPINFVRLVRRNGSGDLWLAAASGELDSSPYGFGVARLNSPDSSWSMENLGLEVNQTISGIIVQGQTRYVSTYGGGITIYNDTGWIRYRFNSKTVYNYADNQSQVFNVPNGTYIPSDYIKAIDFDRHNGILWIATANGGAVSYDGSQWTTYNSTNSGLPSNQLLSVKVKQGSGAVAFGTAGFGAAILDDPGWTVYNRFNSPMTNGYLSTIEFRPGNGEIWFGTGYGVWVLKSDGSWHGFIPPDNDFIWGNFYSDISFDSVGNVWVSAYGGGMASLYLGLVEPPPPPPPTDSLGIDVDRMFIYFYNNRPIERIFTVVNVDDAPPLTLDDSISFHLYSDLGDLYSFKVAFEDFRPIGLGHYRGDYEDGDDGDEDGDQEQGYLYRYSHDRLMIFLSINENNSSKIRLSIKDFDANMNRENYQEIMTVGMDIGQMEGSSTIYLTGDNQWDVPEMGDDVENGPAIVYSLASPLSGIDELAVPGPDMIDLANYPNPFNGNTSINLDLSVGGSVEITVYDMLGRTVDNIYSGFLAAGLHRFNWPRNGSMKSGVYFCRVTVGDQSSARKMTYLK